MKRPEKINVFGTYFSTVDLDSAVEFLKNGKFGGPSAQYVCFPSTDTVATAYQDKVLQNIFNNSLLTFVDGKFTEYYLRIRGYQGIRNVSGYWLMEKLLQTDLSHFFYGCDDYVLSKLKVKLSTRFPESNILGFKSPPFVQVEEIYPNDQIMSDFAEINDLKPDIIWIGISTPKQDLLMYNYRKYLDAGIMFGVGAVFLYHAGIVNKGPEILKKLALRWAFRLIQEPKRLFKRTIPGISHFLLLIIKHDILKQKIKDF